MKRLDNKIIQDQKLIKDKLYKKLLFDLLPFNKQMV